MYKKALSRLSSPHMILLSAISLASCGGSGDPGDPGDPKTDDPLLPSINISSVSTAEGNEGVTDFNFVINLSEASASDVSIDYATGDDTAEAGTDYSEVNDTLIIPAGETSASITIDVNGDTTFESDESFTLNLSNITGATSETSSVSGTILNDDQDTPPVLSISSVSVTEGNSNVTGLEFVISLSKVSTSNISIDYATSDSTATAGTDYTGSNGTLVIPAGNDSGSIVISVTGDLSIEADETFTLNLSNISGATSETSSAIGTILNDDIDTDNDGLTDFAETNIYGTDPNAADTDGDGQNDSSEITARTNPIGHLAVSAPLYFSDNHEFGYSEVTVPSGCYELTAKAWGAGGGQNWGSGGGSSTVGGGGGYALKTLNVLPGDTLEIYVGQGGKGGSGSASNAFGGAQGGGTYHFGGGGGGSTELRYLDERLLVAGGGGGSGNFSDGNGGPGGGFTGTVGGGANGGFGGPDTGLNPNGVDQLNGDGDAHSGAGGGGYSGGGRGTSYGQGGGGGSSFGDSTIAGNGRLPGNAAEAGNSGYGGIGNSYYDNQGPKGPHGSDGKLTLYCAISSTAVVDADNDGVLDAYETSTFLTNPNLADTDGDGLSDFAELVTHHTNPLLTDTDGDGLTDDTEINTHGTDPNISDTDADGLSDGDELTLHSTDPLNPDSDSDTLSDGVEINTHSSNPNSDDSDGDGLTDDVEVNTYLTSPTSSDSDSDGLSDASEVNTHLTNPNLSDSDNDGLNDFFEINTYSTNPLSPDSDGDRVIDSDEIQVYSTDPNNEDSDSDGYTDGDEIIVKPVIADNAVPLDTVTYEAWGLYEYNPVATCNVILGKAWGAGGGQNWASNGNSSVGGGGGYAKTLIDVDAANVVELYVGEGGRGSGMNGNAFGGALGGDTAHFGGGGGGSTELRILNERLLVAGGGGGSGNSSNGHGGAGGGFTGTPGGGENGGFGGPNTGLNPDGVNQTGDGYSAHSGAGGGGYSGGGRGTSSGQGGGGGSSYGDSTIAGTGRAPGNLAEAGNSGFGGVGTSYYDNQGPDSANGSDGKIIVECHVSIGNTGGSNPNDITSVPSFVYVP